MERFARSGIRCAILFWAAGVLGVPQIEAATIYVSPAGNDASDGLTWPTAKRTVQAGLNAAASGDQVWVAAGTYVENIALKSGVALYGGFAGDEDPATFTPGDRDLQAHPTILDGNQSGKVVTAPKGATLTTRIDGFTIRNGNGYSGGGIYCYLASPTIANNTITGNTVSQVGGAIHCAGSSSLIANNTIAGNSASYGGGGIFCDGFSPSIVDNTFTGNKATASFAGGGAIYCNSGSPTVSNNTFKGNIAGSGGAIYCSSSSAATIRDNTIMGNSAAGSSGCGGGVYCTSSSSLIANNAIAGNSATGSSGAGGGIYCASSSPVICNNTITGGSAYNGGGICCSSSSATIANNTITGNAASSSGGAIYCDSGSPVIANSIVAFNSSGIRGASSATVSLRYNCVYQNAAYNYSGMTDPTGTNGNISADPKLASLAYGRLHIQPDSPCIDGGDDTVIQAGWLDMDGQPRLIGGHVDIGADESDGTEWPPGSTVVVRVRADGNDANDGSSWPLAKRSVQAAVNDAAASGGQVWVAGGTYVENILLPPEVAIYGGFAGDESDLAQRNWTANPTILDGNQAACVVTVSIGANETTRIDGFTIRNGNGPASGPYGFGGGIYSYDASLTIANNTITGNSAYGGGGIYCYRGSVTIANNTIKGNTGIGSAGGVFCLSSSALVINNVIASNWGDGGGGILCSNSASMTIVNNTIVGNTASGRYGAGGGIFCDGSSVTIINSIVAFNSSGIYKRGTGTVSLRHNCVSGNAAFNYSGLTEPTGADGNIAADPHLASLPYADMHLQPDSPCVDAGDDSAVQPNWTDVDAQARTMGAHVDIGADESDGTLWDIGPNVIVRVSPAGNDANDGSSWALAKRTVQAGIETAAASHGEVWVAAGTYPECITLREYAHVYGGFAGTETRWLDRDPRAHLTILDGGRQGSVVTISRVGYRLSTIDGITIRNGSGTQPSSGSSMGGGIYCSRSSPTISNNAIAGNAALHGGGIYCGDYCYPIIANNRLSGNTASNGGGIYCTSSSPMIVNNAIIGHRVDGALAGGGGIFSSAGSPIVLNNTIVGNSAAGLAAAGGGIYLTSGTIQNNIVAFNSSGIYRSGSATTSLCNNCVYGNYAYNYCGLSDPTGANGNISADPRLAGAAYGNLHIQSDSPCIDAGDDGVVEAAWPDMDGQPRIIGRHVDIGADEADGTAWPVVPNVIVRVRPQGNDANDGSSWLLAKRTVQAAINAASSLGGDVWVAAGTYVERITLSEYVHVYGGFGGAEAQRSERNWSANVTILDGGQAGSVVTARQLACGLSTIDGFTIRNGNGTLSGPYQYGGGIYCFYASPLIANNTVTGNTAWHGGGICCSSSAPAIVSNTIASNTASSYGGAVYFEGSCPAIAGNTIRENDASRGGGICYSSSSPAITDNVIADNRADYSGGIECGYGSATIARNVIARNYPGGIYGGSSSTIIANNTIKGNFGRGIYCDSSYVTIADNWILGNSDVGIYCSSCSPTVVNNTITGNNAASGAGIYCSASSPKITNTIIAWNSSGICNVGTGVPVLRHTCVYANAAYNFSGLTDPTGTNGNISTDPRLAGVACGNLHVQPDSPCVDAGDDSAVQVGWTDMDGLARVVGPHVDIGADESDGTLWQGPNVVVRVRPTGDDANDGSSWPLAKRTVQAAIDAAASLGGEVWVTGGTYRERISLRQFAHVYGGFAGTESERAARNLSARATVLDGAEGGCVVTAIDLPGYRPSTIDGFVIRNGAGTYMGGGLSAGGICCRNASATIANNVITANRSESGAGGIYCEDCSPVIINSIITGNSTRSAGGIYCYNGSVTIVNCTITGCSGAGIRLGGWRCSATIANTIVAFNLSGIANGDGTVTLFSNDVYGNRDYDYSGLAAGTEDICQDPGLVAPAYGQVHLRPDSPCIDAGDEVAAQTGGVDIDGEPRIQGARVDIGADEFNGTAPTFTPRIVRVSPVGNDANDGSSWPAAKRTVQAGIVEASATQGEVWVAAGTYYECVTLLPLAHVYGGFAGSEIARGQRNWATNASVLDGSKAGSVVTASACGCGVSTIDGLTIRNGSAARGGGISCRLSSPVIANNEIKGNTASDDGGGIYCDPQSFPEIANNTIAGNRAVSGGGIYCFGSSPRIASNTIVFNGAWSAGGVACESSAATIVNNVIMGNSVSFVGGGISCYYSSPTIANTTIVGNSITGADRYGGGIYCDSSFPIIENSIVAYNSTGVYKRPDSSTLSLLSNCVYGNTAYNYSGLPDPTGTNGNISADPEFVHQPNPGPDGTWGTADDDYGDLRLLPGSPCIDAGSNADVPADTADLDGDGDTTEPLPVDLGSYPRFLDDPATPDCPWAPGTCGTPPIVDMGAYEFAADSDGDGVPDFQDDCPDSDLGQTIVINGLNTSVPNQPLGHGCTMADEIAKLAAGARNHGAFVSAVDELTDSWVAAGLITDRQKGRIQSAAGRSRIPGDINADGFVDVSDLLMLAGSFGKHVSDSAPDAACDLNADGAVDVSDLLILAGNWGSCPPKAGQPC